MNKRIKQRYCSALVICHGKSELIFVSSLKSNLKLKIEVRAKNNGNNSIQITSILDYINGKEFSSITKFKEKFEIEGTKKCLKNFKIFILMDFDELEYTKQIKENFLNLSMFKNHWMQPYIVPIYSIKNFDEVMIRAGYLINTEEKVKSYKEIFPNGNGDFERFKQVKRNISNLSSDYTNLNHFLDYIEQEFKRHNS
ncbi:MAG: hypothetical protein RBQ91_06760 [Acholeplasma sp.]|nr:hypothetical protein [Acholeplasma sp.]